MNPSDAPLPRRSFVKSSLIASVGALGLRARSAEPSSVHGIPYRILGKTGRQVSLVGLGGFHIGMQSSENESIEIIRTALDEGINFLDNCWDYNGGASEIRMGKALRDGYRDRAFLMTKIDGRNRKTAAEQIDESLRRLQTDHLDLLQMHEIIRLNDPDRIFAEDGAMSALLEAQKAGKVRHIGFTGHKSPDIHLRMLDAAAAYGITFDTVQMPLNVMDAHFSSFQHKVLPRLVKEGVGVLGMKSMGDKEILKSNTATPVECLHYAMNLPVSVVITGCDSLAILQQALIAARTFKPLSAEAIDHLLTRTSPAAQQGAFELYKTSERFDGTAQNPQWLG